MKKTVFTLGAVTVLCGVCACGLLIDPDKLVGGSADAPETSTLDGPTTPPDSGPDAPADAPDDGPTFVEVPECVPAPPAGTQGPYAVTFVKAPGSAVCPAGYLATPVESAKGSLAAAALVCGNSAGCTCSAPTGTPTCSLRVRYFNDSACTNSFGSDPLGTTCRDIDSAAYLKVETTVTGLTCTNTGPATVDPTSRPTPAFGESWVVCAPDPNVKLAQCKLEQVGLPPAKDAGACVITTAPSCPAPYTEDIGLSKSGTFTDSRTCACSCAGAASTCTGGSAQIFSEDSCSDSAAAFAIDMCLPRNGEDGMKAVAPTPSGTSACAGKATPDGTYTPANDLHLCCLP